MKLYLVVIGWVQLSKLEGGSVLTSRPRNESTVNQGEGGSNPSPHPSSQATQLGGLRVILTIGWNPISWFMRACLKAVWYM